MVKVLVIGAGAQGGSCTSILAGEESVEETRLGDLNLDTAQKVAAKIGSPKIQAFKLDAAVISPDSVDPRFFKGMASRGVAFEFDETIFKHTVIKAD